MYVVTVRFEIESGHVVEFRQAILLQASNSLSEKGCRQFDVCFDPEDETSCFLYERYDDRAAFEIHLASEHFKNFDQVVTPWTKSKSHHVWTQVN